MNLTYNYFLGFINDINDTHVMLIEIEVEPFPACPTALVQKILNLQTVNLLTLSETVFVFHFYSNL